MNRLRNLLGAAALFAALAQPPARAQVNVLKHEPAPGTVATAAVVYVDDGTCARGEIKEITGGNFRQNIPRKIRCVSRVPLYDGSYSGTMTCDLIPGQTSRPLVVEFSMTVADGRVTYEREVMRPDSRERLGVTERGGGTVSPTGEVSLTGYAEGRAWSYAASYRGPFGANSLRLSGTQVWILGAKPAHNRSCAIDVSRSGQVR
jgi:hypothetical protein